MTSLPSTLEKRKQHCPARVLKASNCTEVEPNTENRTHSQGKASHRVGADNHGWKLILKRDEARMYWGALHPQTTSADRYLSCQPCPVFPNETREELVGSHLKGWQRDTDKILTEKKLQKVPWYQERTRAFKWFPSYSKCSQQNVSLSLVVSSV